MMEVVVRREVEIVIRYNQQAQSTSICWIQHEYIQVYSQFNEGVEKHLYEVPALVNKSS